MCGYTLGRRVSRTVSGVTVILTLSSDPSSRKIVSRAYILYCFKVRIPNFDCGYMLGCQGVPSWLGSPYLMTVPVFELPGTSSNMYFVHVNLMNSVVNTKIQKCIKDRLDLW